MQVSNFLVVVLVCVLISGSAEISAGAAAVPRVLLRASVLPAALPHAAAAAAGAAMDDCCRPGPSCCGDDDAARASSDSGDSP
jgi:hypothetical protein